VDDYLERARAALRGERAHPEGYDRMLAEHRELLAGIADLPEEFRDILVAVDVAGLSYKEASKALGVPEGTVMSRLYRARKRVIDAYG
jgi:RNA polymerase sigma-70 factor (ECF subfamily)